MMAPNLAGALRHQGVAVAAAVQKYGALQAVTFKAANVGGFDTFSVSFENAKTDWNIALSPDGKVVVLNFHPAT